MRIDSHQHFWHYSPAEHVWMRDSMAVLKRDFLPEDLTPLLEQAGFQGTVAVQARQNLEETEWLLDLAAKNDIIKGVVGWVDLRSPALRGQLERYSRNPKLVGVRHVVHDEPDDRFMLQPDFLRGLGMLEEFDLTYDLLLFPRHLPIAIEVVKRFPAQGFVVDHIAKPLIKDGIRSPWDGHLRELADFGNVHCKVSGMVTEAAWGGWKNDDFKPYLDIVFDCFSPNRVMFGSDWPVCTLSGAYADVVRIVERYLEALGGEARERVMGRNAVEFYGL
ncbi:MAG: amidohydrolase family protein [Spirochaetota bacterium]